MSKTFLEQIHNGLIVSCQAPEGSPLHGKNLMSVMAQAAEDGGAAAIRAEGLSDVRSIKAAVSIPVLGLIKLITPDTPVIITPLIEHVSQLIDAGADMIAVDASLRKRLDGSTGPEFVARARQLGIPILADIDTLEAAIASEKAGADAVSTTISGYTSGPTPKVPDIALVGECAAAVKVPVIAEGRYYTPEDVARAFKAGAWSVCVGGAITDPWLSTKRFVAQMHQDPH